MRARSLRCFVAVTAVVAAVPLWLGAQAPGPRLDRLRGMPGVAEYGRMQDRLREGPPFVSGAITPLWAADSQSFTYARGGERVRFDLATRQTTPANGAAVAAPAAMPGAVSPPSTPGTVATGATNPCPLTVVDRGRQRECEASPDRRSKAFHRARNLYVSAADGTNERAVTSDGSEQARIKNGIASWVYGEELDQTTAIWWSPDNRKVAFYRFDESRVRDYYLQLDQTEIQSTVDIEAYPKAGTDNPVADILVYDVATGASTRLDVRAGQPFTDEVVGHYVYGVEWAPDASEVRLFRTNRRQQILEYIGCSPVAGTCRVIVRESWPTGWTENRPAIRWLADHKRFLWASDRTGFRSYELYDIAGTHLNAVSRVPGADVVSIVRVDEAAGVLYFLARDGDNHLKLQLHRARLDGTGDVRLTDPRFHHTVSVAPDGRHVVDVYQTHDMPPASRLIDASGAVVAELATSDLSRLRALGLRPVEHFTYRAGDGVTTLRGSIGFPSSYDPSRKYPVLVSVYGGPEYATGVPGETFAASPAMAEYGFLIVSLGTRAAPGHGRRVLDSLYLKLGQAEVDDMARGIEALRGRADVDPARIGMYGTSYGGYASLMLLLRYPDLLSAVVASSAPTDWLHYDTIYTERYMWTPQGNRDGYDRGSAMTYVDSLKGRLLLYYGTADNNVHPSNSLQLLQAFARAGKSVEVQVGPDLGHSGLPAERMMEFFIENLVVRPERLRVPAGR